MLRFLEAGPKIGSGGTGNHVAVWIVSGRQGNDTGSQTGAFQVLGEEARSSLASVVRILVEGDIDATAGLITKLGALHRGQIRADSTGGVAKPACHSEAKSNRPSTRMTQEQTLTDSHINKPPSGAAAGGVGKPLRYCGRRD